MNYIQKVREFHNLFEHPVGKNPEHNEPLKIRQLRLKLLFEELVELAEASDCMETLGWLCQHQIEEMASNEGGYADGDEVDKTEELDALCDIQYVLSGKVLTAGLQDVFDRNFELVHMNNMTKAHRSEAHAKETAHVKKMKDFQIIQKGEYWLLLDSNGKLTKPHDHKKVKLHL